MAVQTQLPQRVTWEEFLALPETMQKCEVVDGELITSPAPTWEHQVIAMNVAKALDTFVKRRKLGQVAIAPVDVVIQKKPKLRVRQPDVLFISHERKSIISTRVEGGPDLVVEILSSSDTRAMLDKKLKDYCAVGVRECWLVSIEAETVEVLRLSKRGAERIGLYGIGDVVVSEVLTGLKLSTKKIFN
ncbi:MAG: Uma2 family endonuclease [Abditibacteriales bacterium]|nr:Uma2 family endonuclease [Abditibacteriales bacterium]MDW8366301.1 Uma2 family endonuclease [Abditibacteriales bacterium]